MYKPSMDLHTFTGEEPAPMLLDPIAAGFVSLEVGMAGRRSFTAISSRETSSSQPITGYCRTSDMGHGYSWILSLQVLTDRLTDTRCPRKDGARRSSALFFCMERFGRHFCSQTTMFVVLWNSSCVAADWRSGQCHAASWDRAAFSDMKI